MPNIITHSLFAQDFMKDYPLPLFEDREHLVQVGSNGPDILFFHNVNPGRVLKKTHLHKIGTELHKKNVNRFYIDAFEAIQREEDPQIKEDMIAYTIGHLLHWSLDSTAHPYVFYRTGTCHGRSSWNHHRLESLIDAAVLKIKRNKTILDGPISIEVSKTEPWEKRAITRIYYPVIQDIYPGAARPHEIAESLDDWNNVQRFLYDPSGKKYQTLRLAETPLRLQRLLSGLIVPVEVIDNADLLNLTHQPWKHPATEQVFTDSFLELYDQAQDKARKVVTLFLNALDNPQRLKHFLAFLDNRNYNMNLSGPLKAHLFYPVLF